MAALPHPETNCDWLFDMSVKRPHERALANESCHLFQTVSPKLWLHERDCDAYRWISVFIPELCLFCAIHFHTAAKDTLLCTLFILQACKNELTVAVLQQNMRAAAFKIKHIILSDLDASVNEIFWSIK